MQRVMGEHLNTIQSGRRGNEISHSAESHPHHHPSMYTTRPYVRIYHLIGHIANFFPNQIKGASKWGGNGGETLTWMQSGVYWCIVAREKVSAHFDWLLVALLPTISFWLNSCLRSIYNHIDMNIQTHSYLYI